MEPKLSVRNVYKIFGDNTDAAFERLKNGESKDEILSATGATVGVQDATFDVQEGEIFVVMGLSGSGKSTLVRMLNGLIPATAGHITIDGEDVATCGSSKLRSIRREKIAMVFQHFALFPHWTIAENVAYGLKISGVGAHERRERALKALEKVGLAPWADSLPQELSGGMQQRVGLARGLATDAEVLLMDEPFSALDPLIRREMQDELLELQRELKKTIIFITHDLNEAMLLGDRVAIMKDGSFVQVATAHEIVSNPADDYVAAFVADIDRGRVFSARHVATVPETAQLGEISGEDALRFMEEKDINSLYMLEGEKLVGLVSYQTLASRVREGGNEGDPIGETMLTDYPQAEADAQLQNLYTMGSSGLPIALLDEKGRFVGVVDPSDLLSGLANEADEGASVPASGEQPEKEGLNA